MRWRAVGGQVRLIQKKVAGTGKSTAQVWRLFDQSFRHTIDPHLYSKAMALLGLNMPPALCQRLIQQYDQNGSPPPLSPPLLLVQQQA